MMEFVQLRVERKGTGCAPVCDSPLKMFFLVSIILNNKKSSVEICNKSNKIVWNHQVQIKDKI